jgi:hypothetical protein
MAENINAFQEEIKALEAKLEAKKREMAASGTETPEKHLFKEVVREHSGRETPKVDITAAAQAAAKTGTIGASTTSPADEQKLDELVMHAFTKGIASAVNEARKMNIPFLVDMLHDRLVDEYYEKLLEARKVNIE